MTRPGATAPRPRKASMRRPATALLPNMRGKNMTRKPTIWEALADRLGREPTHAEACAEVRRILDEGTTQAKEAKP
jgi:hypothetical protein